MSGELSTERRKLWEERNPVISGVLAFLVPGLGHFYQGRWFKGTIYFVCILGTFFGGMKLGEGAVVYNAPGTAPGRVVSLTYLAQVGAGAVALPGFYQAKRAASPENREQIELEAPLSEEFQGELIALGPGQDLEPAVVRGRIELSSSRDGAFPETRGKFVGTVNGEQAELNLVGSSAGLGNTFKLERPISAGFGRKLEIGVDRQSDQHPHATYLLRGTIPRRWQDAYTAPPDATKLQDLHGRLGKLYDLAFAFTMIAGLLNVLAIWDAIEGPAYGFGDEPGLPGNPPVAVAQPTAVTSAPAPVAMSASRPRE